MASKLRIFVNYRRDDTASYAGRLYDTLVSRLPEAQVVLDIDAITAGESFAETIQETVGSADIFLALIGRSWLTSIDADGKPRIENADDLVRLEIEAALRYRQRLIPVLVGGAGMPSSRELPSSLAPLTRRQAIELRDASWKGDAERLIEAIERLAAGEPARDDGESTTAQADEPLPATDDPPVERTYLPRFASDNLEGEDLLERSDKVEFLASVLAAKGLETPLAVGLFGDWGSGKSFFMRRLQERIVELTEASAQALAAERPTLYCSHIRHVSFNAWLYAGSDIWPAFAAQVFREVAAEATEAKQAPTQQKDLLEYQQWLLADEQRLRTDSERRERIDELERRLQETRAQREGLVPDVGSPAGKLVGTAREIGARILGLRAGWRDYRPTDVLVVLVAIAIAVASYTALDASVAAATGAGAVILGGLRYLDGTLRLRKEEWRLQEELEQERALQAGGEDATDDAPPELLLPDFAQREAAEWAQCAHLSSVAQIRMKFDQLSRLLAKGAEAQAKPGAPPGAIPVERVIVYVDDLDRCQPDVVVGVLETLKLLVSLPHFVAVVGVDSRWLFRSLRRHFRDLLQTDGDGVADAAWAATPQNYLEKIFQYSLVLQPISATGFGNLMEGLLASPDAGGGDDGTAELVGESGDEPTRQPAEAGAEAVAASGARAALAGSQVSSPAPTVDLTPSELVISRAEVDFIKGLAPLFETPRAAKRFANVYRLLRVTVGADRLLQADSYERVLLLLGIGIGFPGLAGETFAEIGRSPTMIWWSFVKNLASGGDKPGEIQQAVRDTPVDGSAPTRLEEDLTYAGRDSNARLKLRDALLRCSSGGLGDHTLDSFAPWISVVAEFSFHPWQELLPASAQS